MAFGSQARFPVNTASGLVQTVLAANKVAPIAYMNGMAVDANGALVISTGPFSVSANGLPFAADGSLFITAAPALPVTRVNGLTFDSTGALVVSSAAIANYENGLPFDANGYLCATVT